MNNRHDGDTPLALEVNRNWRSLTLIAWALIALFYLWQRWPAIHWLSLGDTDDNMRLMQVRALLNGQGWYDLRQYRLNPPLGFDMHWSRIVDLPIAGMILAFRPFVGTALAERLACGIAPLLPLSVAMLGLAFTVRRLVSPLAWPLALIFLLMCTATMLMFMPERIDHHGWQLACLSLTVAGLADPQQRRGGIIVGLASAVSLSIGLEMLPYAAGAGAIMGLRWIWDRAEAPRLTVYGLALAGGSAIGYVLFASNANAVLRCDALTPVWLSVMIEAGALLFILARINPDLRWVRFVLAAAAGVAILTAFALVFPQCLGRPEQVSPELAANWLNNVREAKPIYAHPWRGALSVATLPVIGMIGAIIATWRAWRSDHFAAWAAVLLFTLLASGLLLWQVRAGAAAQMLAVPGAVALGWIVLPWCLGNRSVLVRVFGTVVAFLVVSGAFVGFVVQYAVPDKPSKGTKAVNRAGASCPTIPALAVLDKLPPQTIFTFIDLGPRLITLTHHSAVAGPYHRNGDAILDVQHAFTRTADDFHAIARRHGATLLLTCPNMSESTVYTVRYQNGFYARLARGETPTWLEPLPLPKGSPLKLWRIR
ncbi:AcrB/AcrD/AcrF family protein [Sphingomonas sp. 28-63-12]|uniref:AcrB/AcrD/AcrF family protein n=1 Tax=Sphingomonas sp. 28-63-12 TaxID=1970434 RepID=UPI000BC5912B|nr:MAG: hypothetical protein B7Y47_07335 [Sphingomonas sp. 28-63-12]